MLIGSMGRLDGGEELTARPSNIAGIPAVITREDLERALGRLEFCATKAEVDQAYKALTPAQLRTLQEGADFRARAFGRAARGRDGSDLLREAVLKAFIGDDAGGRRWYPSINFFWFLTRAVTSVADNWKKRGALERQTYRACEIAPSDSEGRETSALQSIPSRDQAADQRLLAKAEVEWILSIFENDSKASLVLRGWSEGLEAKEIMGESGLTLYEYKAAARRIRTRLKTKNGGGTNGKH
jgi:DNA-directed RNA polymerase specialized sigma24 family protein